MIAPPTNEITQLLLAWGNGDPQALEQLTPLVYEELRHLARKQMRGEQHNRLLQTTDLLNEAFVRLFECQETRWENRAHFFGLAAKLMRHVLVDYARGHHLARRSGALKRADYDEAALVAAGKSDELIALDDVLRDLEKIDVRKCRIVELRFFGGLSVEETAEVLHLSSRTVQREWQFARAWIRKSLYQV